MTDECWIQTYRGEAFFPLQPIEEDVYIEDIAHALSKLCRFGGHCEQFYSVAQHSVFVSNVCGSENALWGLLHDAAEAYIGDIITPIKQMLPEFKKIENGILSVIAKRYSLFYPMPAIIKHCDCRMLATEKRELMKPGLVWEHLEGVEPYQFTIIPLSQSAAEVEFMERWEELTGK
jgi:hypothetical protein